MAQWCDVEEALGPEEAVNLRRETEAELSDPDFLKQVALAMGQSPRSRFDGEAFFVLGPSAAGKSTALAEKRLQVPPGAMTLDGSIIRETSAVWKKVRKLALARGLAGFSDYFDTFFKPSMDKLKKKILEDAMRRSANLIIPDTGSNFAATKATIQRLRDGGYRLKFAAVFGDSEVLLSRGRARASEDGKQFTGKNWQKSVEAILALQEYLQSSGLIDACGSILVLDNSSSEMRVMSLQELERRWCQPRSSPRRWPSCCQGLWQLLS
ncbi:unnamed protein product [Symbiodinium sp. CCMP2592]|nr:unnamed protein product [Symbiodinium sp. CCMP2592]